MDQSNLDEMIKTIKRLVMLNKDQVPKGSLLWNKKPIKDVDDCDRKCRDIGSNGSNEDHEPGEAAADAV